MVMLRNGYPEYAGEIIDFSWSMFRGTERYYSYSDTWPPGMVRLMEEVTGRSYGWNLKSWKRWWDREGASIGLAATTDNNNG